MVKNTALSEILKEAETLEDLNIPQNLVFDILLRLFYNEGNLGIRRIIQVLRVPHIVESLLNWLIEEKLVEVQRSSAGAGLLGFIYRLTKGGDVRAQEAIERSSYVGPIPVPIHLYNQVIELQSVEDRNIASETVISALDDMVLPDEFHRKIGPALNSISSLFLYGPSGNGKTTIAKKIAEIISGTDPIWIPFAVTAGGQIIQIHDRLIHERVEIERHHVDIYGDVDARWGLFKRPSVVVGGELKMEALDLRYDTISKIYEAPLQMKANGGMFLIDDFGRQQVRPVELLNRWIVPLEDKVDYLRLRTGQTVVVPFRQLLILSTNLNPHDLADDAFFRRIQMKVKVEGPTLEDFKTIFKIQCVENDIEFDEKSYQYLMEEWYNKKEKTLQAVHPRDLLLIIGAFCKYDHTPRKITNNLLDAACKNYFVD